jgi:hypothetical protein
MLSWSSDDICASQICLMVAVRRTHGYRMAAATPPEDTHSTGCMGVAATGWARVVLYCKCGTLDTIAKY